MNSVSAFSWSNIKTLIFKKGLSRTLTIWFSILSLIPLLSVSLVSLDSARDGLRQAAFSIMSKEASEQASLIRYFFKRVETDLKLAADRPGNIQFLQDLIDSLQKSNKNIGNFVGSYSWAKLADLKTAELQKFRLIYGFHDLYFIDKKGNVLYSLAKENDLGTNLFNNDEQKNTLFSKTARKVLETGRVGFSDLAYYKPSGGLASGFVIAPVVTEQGQKIGLIAVQLSHRQILNMQSSIDTVYGNANVYLVGNDLKLRSQGLGSRQDFLTYSIENVQTREWLSHKHQHAKHNEAITSVYNGLSGQQVLGSHQTLDLLGVSWIVVAEINAKDALQTVQQLQNMVLGLLTLTIVSIIIVLLPLIHRIVSPVLLLSQAVKKVQEGDLNQQIAIRSKNELGDLADGFNSLIKNLKKSKQHSEAQIWLQKGITQLNDKIRGDLSLSELSSNTVTFLCQYLGAPIGAFYVVDDNQIKLMGSFSFVHRKSLSNDFNTGEGLVGQAVLERQSIILSEIADDYMTIQSGLGACPPSSVGVFPLIWNDVVAAAVEIGFLDEVNEQQRELIEVASSRICIAIQTAKAREETQSLLIKTQHQAEVLQVQEEELRNSNTLLEKQAQELRQSEQTLRKNQAELEEKNEQLQVQQEELRVANEELEVKAKDLELSRNIVEGKNSDLEQAQLEIQRRAEELEIASKYKSEFLANMSHELRTPLNSLLILSKMLADNGAGNLDKKQVEFAQTIYDSGADLLELINDILDLSKIEAGKMDVHLELLRCDDLVSELHQQFEPVARDKGIEFKIDTENAPETWLTDIQKLSQILKNFLSNAFKFTQQGEVLLDITRQNQEHIKLSVKDTGIGIPEEKRKSIFEAFQQADGTTSRKYGGSGLGLSICRELAKLLGGKIMLESQDNMGSTFSLLLPMQGSLHEETKSAELAKPEAETEQVPRPAANTSIPNESAKLEIDDDRHHIKVGERSILIIEDDFRFAAILEDIAHDRGFKVLIADNGEQGLYFADYYRPSGIILDIGLPGIDGWKVMKQLKDKETTRHIPVHFMSAEDVHLEALKNGAIGYLTKPVQLHEINNAFGRIEHIIDRPVKQLLIVEDDLIQQQSLLELIGNGDVQTTLAANGDEAVDLLQNREFDCMVLDLGLPDTDGVELLETIRTDNTLQELPIVVYTGKDLEPQERAILEKYANSIIIKDARSPEKLLDDTALFLHRVESNLPEERRRVIRMLHDNDSLFKDRKVLIVDDDMRNVFALSSILQEQQMNVLMAKNGIEALEMLKKNDDTAIVLMDIMMPEMDGYEATQKIREQQQFENLPVIALTAKAMKGDRAKCIEMGANDYMAKPIDPDKLVSLMRVWLYR